MGTVSQLQDRTTVMIELDGLEFLCRKPSAALAIEAFGPNCLMVVDGADGNKRVEFDESVGSGHDIMRKYLAKAMISPRLGDEDDDDTDTVTWLTLGDYGPQLYLNLTGEDQAAVEVFPESSEVQKE